MKGVDMAVEVAKIDTNNHKDGNDTHDEADTVAVADGVLFVKKATSSTHAKTVAVYQSGFWISAVVK